MAKHIHIHRKRVSDRKTRDAKKYVTNLDIRLPGGKILPHGSVVYAVSPGVYRPWFAKTSELDFRAASNNLTRED